MTDAIRPVGNSLLAMLSDEESRLVLEAAVRRTYSVDETLMREGDDTDYVQIILDGWVRVSAVGASGDEVLFALRGPGDVLGELAVLFAESRSTTVRAIESVTVAQVSGPRFLELITRRPNITLALAKGIAIRLREAEAVRVDIATLDVTRQVAVYLLRLVRVHGVLDDDGFGVDLPLTQHDIARHLGASLRQVSRSVSVLRNRGVILTSRKRIIVAKPDVLAALAGPRQTA